MLSLGHDDLSLAVIPGNVNNVPLDGEHGDPLWRVNVVPHGHVVSGLRHHHVRTSHPLDKGAVVQDRSLGHALHVDKI